jgi:signal transduction histidine kinase
LLKEFRSLVPAHTIDLKCTDLVTIVEQGLALEMIAYRAAGITVKFDFEDALPLVSLDAARIKQVIVNLCKNAIEAMPNGGCLTLKGYRSQGMVVLEISDTGVGVPEGLNIFELFKTTKPGGTGIGLPLVQQIVLANNGTIAYKSQKDIESNVRANAGVWCLKESSLTQLPEEIGYRCCHHRGLQRRRDHDSTNSSSRPVQTTIA